jgi:predicted nucleic acid-binding protein
MDIVIDTSALIAVIVEEPERTKIKLTREDSLIGSGSIPWVIGVSRTDFLNALRLSKEINMYAYDAYLLDCAIRYKSPLLTLDRKLIAAAKNINVDALEV